MLDGLDTYRMLHRVLPLSRLRSKIAVCALCACLIPAAAVVGYAALAGASVPAAMTGLLAISLTVAAALVLAGAWTLTRPLDVSCERLRAYLDHNRVWPLSSFPGDDAGELLRHVNRIVQRSESQRFELDALREQDGLTGVLNKRVATERLTQGASLVKRSDVHLTVAMVDIDGLQVINDRLGAEAGDRVLKDVAQRLHDAFRRETDCVARWEEDTFLITSYQDLGHAQGFLDALRAAIEREHFRACGESVRISISAGATEYSGREPARGCLRRALDALHEAQGAGGNRTVSLPPKALPA